MKQVKKQIADEISGTLGIKVEDTDVEVPDGDHGDFAYPAMKAASELGEAPRDIAENLQEEFELGLVDRIDVAGPGYVNFFVDQEKFAEIVEETVESDKMGVEQHDGNMLVEFSSPNLAKPMHIGHLRNNVLGDALQRIMRFAGYDVTSENYIGDWGTKHGQVIYAFKQWGSMDEFEKDPMGHMYDLYVRLHDEADEEDQQKAREWSKKIEQGDEEARELWKMFREATIEHNEEEYERMGISFDRYTGESVVAEDAEQYIQEGLELGIFEEDEDGSVFVEFREENLPNTVIKRNDGSTLYLTRDIANIAKRENEGFDYNLYVVATEQDLHFQQLFNLAEKFGITDIENEHISYGMLHLEEGSMSSSKGNIIKLSDIMDKATEKAREKSKRDINNAENVGIGAIKFANLKVSRQKDIEFSWDRALSFEGDSGPYIQYSNVRAKGILDDAEVEEFEEFNEEEFKLLKKISEFPEHVDRAAVARDPAKISNYLISLCEAFNSFYHSCKVQDSDKEGHRAKLVELFVDVSNQGLSLLGLEPLEEM